MFFTLLDIFSDLNNTLTILLSEYSLLRKVVLSVNNLVINECYIDLTFRLQHYFIYFAMAIPTASPTVKETKKKWNSVGLKDVSPVIE